MYFIGGCVKIVIFGLLEYYLQLGDLSFSKLVLFGTILAHFQYTVT